VLGDLEGTVHVGPAQVAGIGRMPWIWTRRSRAGAARRSFTATAVGLKVLARGDAAREAVDLLVQVDAPDLQAVTKAIAAITKKPADAPSPGERSSTRACAGKPLAPDAEVHLRAPRFGQRRVPLHRRPGHRRRADRRPAQAQGAAAVGKLTLTARDVLAGRSSWERRPCAPICAGRPRIW